MQSRRDCKSDPRFDRLVALLFNDVDEYEKQQVDQEALDKAFQLGAELSRQQEHRRATMPKMKRGPLPRARTGSGSISWAADQESPAIAAAGGVDDRASSPLQHGSRPQGEGSDGHHRRSPSSGSHKRRKLVALPPNSSRTHSSLPSKISHRKGASRKSRHGRSDALHVPLEDDDADASELAQQLTQQAQRASEANGLVAVHLLPDARADGLPPLDYPYVTAPATATVDDMKTVVVQLHEGLDDSTAICIDCVSQLKDSERYVSQPLTTKPGTTAQLQSLRKTLDPTVTMLELSTARDDAFHPLILAFRTNP